MIVYMGIPAGSASYLWYEDNIRFSNGEHTAPRELRVYLLLARDLGATARARACRVRNVQKCYSTKKTRLRRL